MASASSTATVTIDRHYFETLLRRASHAGVDATAADCQISPSDLLVLRNTARKYENLRRNLIRGGVKDPTIELLSQDDSEIQQGNNNHHAATDDASRVTPTTYRSPHIGVKAPPDISTGTGGPYNGHGDSYSYDGGYRNNVDQGAWANEEPDGEDLDYDEETTVDGAVGANHVAPQKSRNGQYDMKCTRTVLLSNLAEGTTHADITDAVRGGLLLDIFLRPRDRCVALSFLHAVDARAFLDHVRKNDLYIKNKRVIAKWNERQFVLAGHAVGKISSGATRNLVLRNINRARHTEKSIRDDLDHIHNLVVIKVGFVGKDCHIKTNSINYALFARTCMMSRGKYRGMRIEYGPDECARPYDADQQVKLQMPRREAPPQRKGSNLSNRFQLLNVDDGGSEEDGEEVSDGNGAKNGFGVAR